MKSYPSIDRTPLYGTHIYAFDKLDGSNIRAEWSRKNGFWKFGRRNGLLDHSCPVLLAAPDLIRETHEDALGRIFTEQRWQKTVVFFEFWGTRSFAGNHEDEPHQVTLLDVAADKKGILAPRDYLKVFEDKVPMASLLYQGTFNRTLEEEVRSGALPGMTFEGIVCKGSHVSPGLPLMFKVKNQAWLDRLRTLCGDDATLFEKMR